jgi:hypothetical protein
MRFSQRPKKQVSLELIIEQSTRYEIGGTDHHRGYNMEQSHENTSTDEMTHFNQMTI